MIDFEEFFKNNNKRLVGSMRRHVGGDYGVAEDIVQEAFLRAIKYQHSYNPKKAKMSVWFNYIMFNVLRDHKKGNIIDEPFIEEAYITDTWEPMTYELFEKELDKVKNNTHKRVLECFYIFGYSSKDISCILEDVSQTNVTTITNRFKQQLEDRYGVSI